METIDKVKQMIANGVLKQEDAEKYFPELKESEDERIINLLKMVVEKWHNVGYADYVMDIPKSDILSWLEKQGKQKTYGQRKECVDCQFNYAGECKGSCAMKRDEQKPVTWSEEDERSIRDSIFYLKSAKKYFEKDNDILWDEKWFNLCIEWLESLRERYTWKPSDEQMNALKEACDEHWEPDGLGPLYTLWEQLKKLKEE